MFYATIPWSLWAENFFLEISFSDRKFSKSKYFKSFSGNYWAALSLSFRRISMLMNIIAWGPQVRNYSSLLFMFHATLIIMSRKYIFDFRSLQLPFDIRFWTRVLPWKCDIRRQASPLQLELESASSRYRRYVSTMTWIDNFLSQSFSENHFSPRFMLPCSLLAEIFFQNWLTWKFWLQNQRKLSNWYYENWFKKSKFWLRNQRPNPPPPPPVINRKHLETPPPPRLICDMWTTPMCKTDYGGEVTGPRSACHSAESLMLKNIMHNRLGSPGKTKGGGGVKMFQKLITQYQICERPLIHSKNEKNYAWCQVFGFRSREVLLDRA